MEYVVLLGLCALVVPWAVLASWRAWVWTPVDVRKSWRGNLAKVGMLLFASATLGFLLLLSTSLFGGSYPQAGQPEGLTSWAVPASFLAAMAGMSSGTRLRAPLLLGGLALVFLWSVVLGDVTLVS